MSFLDGCTNDRRSGTASVPKVMVIVEVNARYPGISAGLDPDRTEVLAPELAALRADEHQAAGTGFGVAVEVDSEIRHDLRRERDNPLASRRLRHLSEGRGRVARGSAQKLGGPPLLPQTAGGTLSPG